MNAASQGWTNSAQLFSNGIIQEVLTPLNLFITYSEGACQWIDDTLFFSKSFEGLLDMSCKFFAKLKEKKLRLSLKKTEFYGSEVTFAGGK